MKHQRKANIKLVELDKAFLRKMFLRESIALEDLGHSETHTAKINQSRK